MTSLDAISGLRPEWNGVASGQNVSRDLTHVYRPDLPKSAPDRYDMPPEWFRITIGGTTGLGAQVSATDPLTGGSTGVKVVSRNSDQLVLDVARSHGFKVLWITCNPENVASRRTCELVGGQLIDIVDLPPETDMYKEGERQKCRYRFVL